LNLAATAGFLRQLSPGHVVLVCAGTRENIALEDVLAAGALCEMLEAGSSRRDGRFSDSVEITRRTYAQAKAELAATVATSENARRLLAIPDLRDDVPFCLQHNIFPLVACLQADGVIQGQPLP
jgi:phosphosulfolactate phosphohydrolase-like enzyme